MRCYATVQLQSVINSIFSLTCIHIDSNGEDFQVELYPEKHYDSSHYLFVLSDVVAHVRCISIILHIVFSLEPFNDAFNDVYTTFFCFLNSTYATYWYRQYPERTPCRCNSKLNDPYWSVKPKHRLENLNSEIFEFAGVADFEKSVCFCAIEFS